MERIILDPILGTSLATVAGTDPPPCNQTTVHWRQQLTPRTPPTPPRRSTSSGRRHHRHASQPHSQTLLQLLPLRRIPNPSNAAGLRHSAELGRRRNSQQLCSAVTGTTTVTMDRTAANTTLQTKVRASLELQ